MSRGDTARSTFAAAREEIITRMQQRDNVLLGYLAAIGAIFGVLSGATTPKPGLLWLLPFLAFGASILVAQHHEVIGSIQDFLVFELEPFLKDADEDAPQWNSSTAHKEYSKRAIGWRFVAHFVLILVPALVGLYLYWTVPTEHIGQKRLGYGAVIAASVVVLMISHVYRWDLYRKFDKNAHGSEGKKARAEHGS